MIELFYYNSCNVHKVVLFLEEAEVPYKINFVDIHKGEHYSREDVVRVAPNNKLPVIIDDDPVDGAGPISTFESCAILLYLAEKTGEFLSSDLRERHETRQWLFWQAAGLGPIGGQTIHFRNSAFSPENDYAVKRFTTENSRLLGVLDRRLAGRDFIMGHYSIADMACYPWLVAHDRRKQLDFTSFPDLKRWFDAIAARPGTHRAYARPSEFIENTGPRSREDFSDETRRIMFGEYAVRANAAHKGR